MDLGKMIRTPKNIVLNIGTLQAIFFKMQSGKPFTVTKYFF